MILTQRPRRNRKTEALRSMIAETDFRPQQLTLPLFIMDGHDLRHSIVTMPGIYRQSPDQVLIEVQQAYDLGIRSVALFPAIEEKFKDSYGNESMNANGLVPLTVKMIKNRFPEMIVITDIALDPFSSDGHDGIVREGEILNDETVEIFQRMAIVHAQAGADIVAPSDMMDGRIGAIRKALEQEGFINTGILSYSAKYASGFYGPFRDALASAPKFGDKKTYQMDYRNRREAIREVLLDVEEGADIVMVKPAWSYLDVIQSVKETVQIPVAAYNVSGEYAMIKAAAQLGMLDETKAMVEMLYSMRRAGADIIFTYFALPMAKYLRDHQT